jgi:nickel/cobalt transporter (NiCoT) family protein
MRKLYYDLSITSVSVLVAIVIGLIESLGLIDATLGLGGAFWDGIGLPGSDIYNFSFIIIGLFLVT